MGGLLILQAAESLKVANPRLDRTNPLDRLAAPARPIASALRKVIFRASEHMDVLVSMETVPLSSLHVMPSGTGASVAHLAH